MIYLDNNATTPLDAEVKKAMAEAFEVFGNPSSGHAAGRAAKALVEGARGRVAGLIGCRPEEIVFTSGGTEANNLAIVGTAHKLGRGHIITSVIEHPSVANPVRWLEAHGFEVSRLPVDSEGRVSPADVKKALRKDTILITVMHSNNETGALQPVSEIGEIARSYDIPFHSDAAQSVGKMEMKVGRLLPVDMLTIVPHKFYGPKGVGALYIRGFGSGQPNMPRNMVVSGHVPHPVLFGAGHESGMRPGTENITGIAGLGKACEVAARALPTGYGHMLMLRDNLHRMLAEGLAIKLNGPPALRLPNTLNVSVRGILAENVVAQVKDVLAISTGSACHSGTRIPSSVLKTMGLSDEDALSSLRLSVGKYNTAEEIEEVSEILTSCIRRQL
ncbi:MAG TPA: cysteine desulfurase family protein [Dissulfurispiraceae bacterium]